MTKACWAVDLHLSMQIALNPETTSGAPSANVYQAYNPVVEDRGL